MKFTEDNCMDEVLNAAPGFRPAWQEHLDFWDGEPAGLTLDMIELATYASALLELGEKDELPRIFALMESMLGEGSEDVKDAVATGFLETVVNPVTAETPYLPALVGLLGEKSKAYCQDWLRFTGGKLPDLSG